MSDDRFDNRRYYNEDTFSIQSTAGAVPVKNKKGEVTMEKVKVNRYVSGKRPDYARGGARSSSESESSDEDDFTKNRRGGREPHREAMEEDSEDEEDLPMIKNEPTAQVVEDANDPRLRRLRAAKSSVTEQRHPDSDNDDDQVPGSIARHRRIHEPEVLSEEDEEVENDKDEPMESSSSSGEEDLDDDGIQRRRELMRQRALARAQIGMGQEEVMAKEDEKAVSEESDSEETTEEETTDSEQEEGARFKPVFVRKRDRLTVQEREREEAKQRQNEREAAILAEQRRRDTLRMVENTVKMEEEKKKTDMAEKVKEELREEASDHAEEAAPLATESLEHSEVAIGDQSIDNLNARVAELEEELNKQRKLAREKEISSFAEGLYESGKLTEQVVPKGDLLTRRL